MRSSDLKQRLKSFDFKTLGLIGIAVSLLGVILKENAFTFEVLKYWPLLLIYFGINLILLFFSPHSQDASVKHNG